MGNGTIGLLHSLKTEEEEMHLEAEHQLRGENYNVI